MRFLLLLTASACALASGAPALAETAQASPVSEVVVTATRLPSDLDFAPDARVIDSAEIEARGAVFATDILATVPGLSVFENGAFGGVASVRMRGASSDKTLVLLDGVPMNDPSQPSGAYDFSGLDLSGIDRIEILSGPQGSLWGSQAIGGVISLTTRQPNGIAATIEGGSYGTERATLAAGRSTGAYAYGVDVAGFRTDGISKADAADGNTERDGFESFTAGANGRVRLNDVVTLDGRVRYSRDRTDLDGYPFPDFVLKDDAEVAKSQTWSGYVRATVAGPFGFTHRFSLSAFNVDRSSFGGDFPYAYTGERKLWRWTAERGAPSDRIGVAFGAERTDDKAQLSDGSDADLSSTAVFGVVRVRPIEKLTTTFSLRYDHPDRFSGVTTARASGVYQLPAGFAVQGSWGQGFKAPTISEAVCDFCFPAGPADLAPEHASGFDLGLRWRSPKGNVLASVTGYRLDVKDQIDFCGGRYCNIARARTDGAEAELQATLGHGISTVLSYAYTDAVDRSTGLALLRVPQRQASASLRWSNAKARAAINVRSESTQADVALDGFSRTDRDGFVTADFTGGWKLTDQVEATLRVVNLADKHYQEVLGFGEPGRSAYVGLKLRY